MKDIEREIQNNLPQGHNLFDEAEEEESELELVEI